MRQKEPLRALSQQEERELQRIVKATSERVDVVKRARALLAVKAGKAYTQAAREAGLKSGDSVSQLVARFNERGLPALQIAAGRGRKASYTPLQRRRILQEVQREPDRKADQTATWSLSRLQRALRKSDLPHIARETIRQTLHEADYSYQQSRTWCRTGYALRKRKAGTVTVYDEQTPEKKDGSNWPTSRPKRRAWRCSRRMKPVPIRPSPSPAAPGNPKVVPSCNRMNTSVAERPNC